MAQSGNISDKLSCSDLSAGFQKFSVLQFDAAVDGMVEAPVGCHEVGDNLSVVNSGQQVERHLYGQRSEELSEPHGRLNRNNYVTGPVKQRERRHSGRKQEGCS